MLSLPGRCPVTVSRCPPQRPGAPANAQAVIYFYNAIARRRMPLSAGIEKLLTMWRRNANCERVGVERTRVRARERANES